MGAARNRGTKAERIEQAQARMLAEQEAARAVKDRVADERQARIDALPEDQKKVLVVRDMGLRQRRATSAMNRAAVIGLLAGLAMPRR